MKKNKGFDRAYKMLPPKLRIKIKKRLMKDAFMVDNNQSFYRKKNGQDEITDYEWRRVQDIFFELGVDAKTGTLC